MIEVRRKILSHFSDLSFEESVHTYHVKGKKVGASVSKLIEDFYEKFDTEGISKRVALRDGVSQEKVKEGWAAIAKQACDTGHVTHSFGELYPFDRSLKPSNKFEEAIVKFWNDLPPHIIPVLMECRMYHKEYMFAGTSDILLYDTIKGYYILGDYKTNKDLFKNYMKKALKPPFIHLLDSPFNKYQIQLSYYQILFEQTGLKIGERKLIWLLPTGNYLMYDTEDLTSTLNRHLKSKHK